MGKFHGKNGSVTVGSVTLHASSFTVDVKCEAHDVTDFDSTADWEEYLAGLKGWKGTVEGFADDTAGYGISNLGSTAACVFTLISGTTLSGSAIITDIGGSEDVKEPTKVTYELQGTGALS